MITERGIHQSIQTWFEISFFFFIFDLVKRQKLRTMEAASKKAKLKTSQEKLV